METRDWCIALVVLIALLVFISPGFAYECGDGYAQLWWTMNSTTTDICGGIATTNNGMAYVAAVFDDGGDAELGEMDSWNGLDGPYETGGSRSWGVWLKPESVGSNQFAMCKRTTDNDFNLWTLQATNNSFRCSCGNAGAIYHIYSTTTASIGVWERVVCTYDSVATELKVYVNGSLEATNTIANCPDTTSGRLVLGCYCLDAGCHASPIHYDGVFDEAFYANKTLNSTEVTNDWKYANFSGLVGPVPGTGCAVTLNTPADNDHTNDQTPLFNQSSIVCYGASMAYRCYVLMNGTQSGDNSTSLTNGSWFEITANTSKAEGSYEWNISCIQGAVTNTTATRTLVIDITLPVVVINIPTPAQNIYYGESTNLDTYCTDTYAFNFTADILNGSGVTFVNQYINDTGSPPVLNLTNEFSSGLDVGSDYWVNASCTDSHTGKSWKADYIYTDEGLLLIGKDGNQWSFTWNWNVEALYEEQPDRVKWGTVAQCDNNGDIKVKFLINCNNKISVIENSEYAGHVVCGGMFTDFQDLAEQGFNVKVVPETYNSVEVEIEKEDAGAPFEWVPLDPATSGLNIGFALANFSVLVDSALAVNATDFYVSTEGFLIIYYTNITTGALITGANCSYNITDPYANTVAGNATETAGFYMGNFTPSFTGTHSYVVWCSAATWYPRNATGTFSVSSAPPIVSIEVEIGPNSMGWSNASCASDDVLRYTFTERVCVGSYCEDVNIYEDVYCELGCIGKICRQSWLRENSWFGYLLVMAAGIAAFYYIGKKLQNRS